MELSRHCGTVGVVNLAQDLPVAHKHPQPEQDNCMLEMELILQGDEWLLGLSFSTLLRVNAIISRNQTTLTFSRPYFNATCSESHHLLLLDKLEAGALQSASSSLGSIVTVFLPFATELLKWRWNEVAGSAWYFWYDCWSGRLLSRAFHENCVETGKVSMNWKKESAGICSRLWNTSDENWTSSWWEVGKKLQKLWRVMVTTSWRLLLHQRLFLESPANMNSEVEDTSTALVTLTAMETVVVLRSADTFLTTHDSYLFLTTYFCFLCHARPPLQRVFPSFLTMLFF